MAKISTPEDLLVEELKDLHGAEIQLIQALPAMVKAATNPDLRKALSTHLQQTQIHVKRLEKIGKALDASLEGKPCKAIQGLVAETEEVMNADSADAMRDLALIAAAQKVEHYEIAGYGVARSLAENAGRREIAAILQTTLDEEGDTDKLLTSIAIKVDLDAATKSGAA